MKTPRLVILLLLVLLAACATPLPPPAPQSVLAHAPAPVRAYRIQIGDSLDIKFFYNPELNETVTVRPDGKIALQLVKEIEVAGRTAAQLTELLIERYSPQIKSPEITVLVRTFNTEKVYVDGEVNKSGLVALSEPMTILQAISQAGGAKQDSARLQDVILIRMSEKGKTAMTLNLEAALDGSDPRQDVALLPYDIVFVPRTTITNVDLWVDQYIRRLLPFSLSAGVYKGYP
ncbi:polysaccharide biosynthesis/export family protein [Geomesophilobacter sediminis]|uniref:Polysaccharide export protein n=1 Tax=Geomesophilobacter sediminis TaxID=2798584 RepID=A0A8J7LYP6_9BACT|nr:polysaccharide biosynthesis/export family protein [Geomesophilobacter sediminis]MBJ6725356.1 polysaccharide export protein [Geomesophilobacter sediminis]